MASLLVRFLAVALTLQHVLVSASPLKRVSDDPVCIVGAGPAGLTAASLLEGKGYSTVIFDKQEAIGGKCQSYYDDDLFIPLGAAFFSNGSYPETLNVIDAAGVPASPISLSASGGRARYAFDYKTGAIAEAPVPTKEFMKLVTAEVSRYVVLWQKIFAPVSAPNFKNGVPKELTVSAAEWFKSNNFTALPVLVTDPVALYGYGDISVVPALYILQYLTPDMLLTFGGQQDAYLIDFQKMWLAWVQNNIKGTIHTSTDITKIDRTGSSPVLTHSGGTQSCSSVILAFPPTLENLANAGFALTSPEKAVFSAVGVHNYFTTAVKLNLPYGVSYVAAPANNKTGNPPPDDGEPVAMLRLNAESDITVSWSWGPYGTPMSEEYARTLAQSTLSKINKDPRDPGAVSALVTDEDMRVFRKWDYFPHFDGAPLAEGVYGKLNALQGSGRTYWASGLAGFENVEWAIRGGKDVVDSYF